MGTVNVKVCERDFVRLWDGTVMHRSLAERKLLEAYKSEVMNLGKRCRARGGFVHLMRAVIGYAKRALQ